MAYFLTHQELRHYKSKGFVSPVKVLSSEDAENYRNNYNKFRSQAAANFDVNAVLRSKPHLVFPWLYDLVVDPAITNPVSSVLGPNLLAWGSSFFAKAARDTGFVSWHQDINYWGLEPHNILTAWIAFSPSRRENGCMRVVPGSHLDGALEHQDTFAANNLLTRGQEILVEVDEDNAVDITLEAGEMSLHHVSIVHGSEPNSSQLDRIGFAVRYISTEVQQIGGRTTATLARGVDEYNHFDPEPRPKKSFDRESQKVRANALERQHNVLFKGADPR